jgi:hypothetical protein
MGEPTIRGVGTFVVRFLLSAVLLKAATSIAVIKTHAVTSGSGGGLAVSIDSTNGLGNSRITGTRRVTPTA